MLIDYHVHSRFSFDSKADIDEIVKNAINKGIKKIAITDHFDPYNEDREYLVYDRLGCKEEIFKAKEKYKKEIDIVYGVELGQVHTYEKECTNLLKQLNYEFVLCSLHNLRGDLDLYYMNFTKDNINFHMKNYMLELVETAKFYDYDILSHLDLPKRYVKPFTFNIFDYTDLLDEVLKIVIEKGRGIELNLSGLRQGLGETLPHPSVLKRYKELGGHIITIGSDAHYPQHVGANLEDGIKIIKEIGFKYITAYNNRKPEFFKI